MATISKKPKKVIPTPEETEGFIGDTGNIKAGYRIDSCTHNSSVYLSELRKPFTRTHHDTGEHVQIVATIYTSHNQVIELTCEEVAALERAVGTIRKNTVPVGIIGKLKGKGKKK